jgi:hypothetical protein
MYENALEYLTNLVDRSHDCGVINSSSLQIDLMPLRGDAGCFAFGVKGMNKGRFGQLGADGAVFLFEVVHKRKWLSC